MEERIILEINPRTKEKKLVKVTDLILYDDYTIQNLIDEHNAMQKQLKSLILLNNKLIDVVSNISKSTAVQIADIKEEIK
jgi:hypothetical protein